MVLGPTLVKTFGFGQWFLEWVLVYSEGMIPKLISNQIFLDFGVPTSSQKIYMV
jgi:hypothetical protein